MALHKAVVPGMLKTIERPRRWPSPTTPSLSLHVRDDVVVLGQEAPTTVPHGERWQRP